MKAYKYQVGQYNTRTLHDAKQLQKELPEHPPILSVSSGWSRDGKMFIEWTDIKTKEVVCRHPQPGEQP